LHIENQGAHLSFVRHVQNLLFTEFAEESSFELSQSDQKNLSSPHSAAVKADSQGPTSQIYHVRIFNLKQTKLHTLSDIY
jgi:hypothetical protein